MVVAIDAKRRPSGGWEVYVKGGTEPTGLDVVTWLPQLSPKDAARYS